MANGFQTTKDRFFHNRVGAETCLPTPHFETLLRKANKLKNADSKPENLVFSGLSSKGHNRIIFQILSPESPR